MTDAYLRYPSVHADKIVFVADDDLWQTSTKGGGASRLTNDHVPVRNPRFSPDGTRIAFTSRRAGGNDVYVRQPDGTVTRLTWLSDDRALVSGWLDDDHVLFCSGHESAHRGITFAYSVDLNGGMERLRFGAAGALARSAHRAWALITPNYRDSAAWKRYRGGMAAQLWLNASANGKGGWTRALPDEAASCYSPTWVGERCVFSSDKGGRPDVQAQLWSVDATGGDLKQHTRHTADHGYVRDPSSDGTQLVYHCRGEIYYLSTLSARPKKLTITTGLGEPTPISPSPTENLNAIVPDHGGDASLVEWRGAAFLLTHRAGPARALSDLPGVRIREPHLLGRTGRAIWATDAEGDDCLEIMPIDADGDPIRIGGGKVGRVLHLASNPDGTEVAVVSHDGRVLVVTVASGKVREVGRSLEGEAEGLAFSPDGRYLVWRSAVASEGAIGQLMCVDLESSAKAFALTKGQFNDFSPVFTSDGKYLAFLSGRTFDPVYDEVTFDLSHTHTVRPWLIPLRADESAPFGASADGWAISQLTDEDDKQAQHDDDKPANQTPPKSDIDVDSFEERIIAFPVPSGRYVDLQATKTGVAWRKVAEKGGELGSTRAGVEGDEPKDSVEHFSFTTRKAATVVEGCTWFAVTGDGERIVVRDSDELWVQPSDNKPGEDDNTKVSVDLKRLRRRIKPRDEWRQMFDENGRLMATHFWREDMGGVDWAGVLTRYRPLIERLATHDDLVDLLWETVGELNTSHAYVQPADLGGDRSLAVGHLGAVLGRNAKGEVVITEVLPGESSDPQARSPLRAAGVAAKAGDVIVAVDGRPVVDAASVGALLQGSADKVVELTLAKGRMKRRVAVVPIASEAALRYHAWVANRAAYVDKVSNKRLGYVHIPDMVASGWAEFHRLINAASEREGVIVDVRFNKGGHTSQLIIERLNRAVLGWGFGRHYSSPMTYPFQAMRGPVVLVTNCYAGSDGDIVSAATQVAGIGPVVGQRSWGGVVGIDGRFTLVDGTGVTQPRYASYYTLQGFGIENHGVDPDIEVRWGPEDWESETDTQLDAAVAEALSRLKLTPAAVAPDFEPPRFA